MKEGGDFETEVYFQGWREWKGFVSARLLFFGELQNSPNETNAPRGTVWKIDMYSVVHEAVSFSNITCKVPFTFSTRIQLQK